MQCDVVVAVKQHDVFSVLSHLLNSTYTKMNALITTTLLDCRSKTAFTSNVCVPPGLKTKMLRQTLHAGPAKAYSCRRELLAQLGQPCVGLVIGSTSHQR